MSQEVTKKEILEAINAFAMATEDCFRGIDARFNSIESRLSRVESQMVTKDYLDRKLWGLRGDMVAMMKRLVGEHETRFHGA